jgi:hypothetical protein
VAFAVWHELDEQEAADADGQDDEDEFLEHGVVFSS